MGDVSQRLTPGTFLVLSRRAPGHRDLPDPVFRTLAVLASYMNARTRLAFPGTRRLARERGLGQRTIQKHLALLQELGHIELVNQQYPGWRQTRRFRLVLAAKPSTN